MSVFLCLVRCRIKLPFKTRIKNITSAFASLPLTDTETKITNTQFSSHVTFGCQEPHYRTTNEILSNRIWHGNAREIRVQQLKFYTFCRNQMRQNNDVSHRMSISALFAVSSFSRSFSYFSSLGEYLDKNHYASISQRSYVTCDIICLTDITH